MEVGPHGTSPESAPQPDLLELFGEVEVTIFGMTGTFANLAGMCPLDPSDPRFTTEAKNEFVVKAANEAGLAIDRTYEPLFTQIIRQEGLERKFTTAVPVRKVETKLVDELLKMPATVETPAQVMPHVLARHIHEAPHIETVHEAAAVRRMSIKDVLPLVDIIESVSYTHLTLPTT